MTDNNHTILLQLQDVVKTYEAGAALFVALKNVNLDIKQGELLGITGKSGAGKTTLLNMISGVSKLTSGRILSYRVEDDCASSPVAPSQGGRVPSSSIPIHSLNEDNLAQWRGKNLGIIYQSFELMPTLNLVENVMFPPDFVGVYHPVISKKRALELLELVEIAEHAYKIPAHISGGQKQRVAIARALINDPQLIIADEPTGNLDSVTAETIFQLFEKLVARGKTIVMVTHDESFVPRFSRHLRIADGVVTYPRDNDSGVPQEPSLIDIDKQHPPLASQSGRAQTSNPTTSQIEIVSAPVSHRTETPVIVLRNVRKVYENAAGKFVALKSINLQLDYGQFVSVVGKSGCGKSTLLNMITGIDHPTEGEVLIGNENIYKMSESRRALWRGRNLGVVFQFFQLLPTLTLLENTMLPMDYCNPYPFHERPDRAMDFLKMVGLEDQAHKYPTAVSSGQQQSAAIARALATDPPIILADEPTGNLDSGAAENILSLFESLTKQGKTILIVTHDRSVTQRTDQTIILSDGEIIDQAVTRALPLLSHSQMLAATKQAKKQKVAPGATILKQGEAVEHFFVIVAGEVEVVATSEQGREMPLARLGHGQFFGEIELTQGGRAIARVQSTNDGAEVALLPKQSFYELIESSPSTRQALYEVAKTRLAENYRRRKFQR